MRAISTILVLCVLILSSLIVVTPGSWGDNAVTEEAEASDPLIRAETELDSRRKAFLQYVDGEYPLGNENPDYPKPNLMLKYSHHQYWLAYRRQNKTPIAKPGQSLSKLVLTLS